MRQSCPNCGADIKWGVILPGPEFKCPRCREALLLSKAYRAGVSWAGMLLALLFTYVVGSAGVGWSAIGLILLFMIGFLPATFVALFAAALFLPPQLEYASPVSLLRRSDHPMDLDTSSKMDDPDDH